MVVENENNLSAGILDLFKVLKCIYRDEVEGQLSLWSPLIYTSPKEIMTKFSFICLIIPRSGILLTNIN